MMSLRLMTASVAAAAMISAASATVTDTGVIERIDGRMAHLDSLIFSTPAMTLSPDLLGDAIVVEPDAAYASAVDALVDARISAIKAQTGIQLTGQTYYRADGALGLDDEDEAVSRYTGKIQAEARWYFLQSGLLKRQGRFEEVRLKGELDRLEHERDRSAPGLYARRERLQVVSDSILASVMLHRVENLKMLEEAYMYLLGNENISGDELLRVLDERAEAERRLATIAVTPTPADRLSSLVAVTVAIDTAAVIDALKATDIDLRIVDLKSRLLDRQADNTTWWSDVRMAPFVRYSHYFRHDMPSSANVDAGVSFTIPINAEASRQRKVLLAQKEMLVSEHDEMVARATEKVRYLSLEVERLNRALRGEWQRAASLKHYLSVRRNAYDHREGEYNRLAALKEYNSYLRSLENIVEMQYRRDCLLADIQTLVPAIPVLEFCSLSPLSE